MEEQVDMRELVAWLNSQWIGPKICPICKQNKWNISDKPVEVRQFQGGGLVVGGQVYPLIAITCTVCGYTLLINAIVAGLLKPEAKEPPGPSEAEQSKAPEREGQ